MKRLSFCLALGTLFCCIFSGMARNGDAKKPARKARVFVVSPTGDDRGGDGSEARPFATLGKAAEDLIAGDQVRLKPGTYLHTQVVVRAQGTESAPIRIAADSGASVTLVGEGVKQGRLDEAEDKSKIPAVLDVREAKYVTIENLEITDSPGYGIGIWDSENISVRKCRIHHIWSRGLGGSGAHLLFEENDIYDVVLQNEDESVFAAQDKGQVRYWSAAAATWYRPGGTPSRDITWRKNRIHESWGEGLTALMVDGAKLEGNEVFNTYSGLIYIDHSRNVVVDSNFIYHSDRKRVRRDEKDVSPGIYFASEGYRGIGAFEIENIQITRNVIVNVGVGIGYWRDPGNPVKNTYKNVLIAGNLVYGPSIITVNIPSPSSPSVGASNRISGNILFEPSYLWRLNPLPVTLRLENPELWSVEGNLFVRPVPTELTSKLSVFSANITADPKLSDPHSALPMRIENFRPRCDSPVWKAKGGPIGPWKDCAEKVESRL